MTQIASRGIRRKASALHLASCAHIPQLDTSLSAKSTLATPGRGNSTQRHGRSASTKARAPVNLLTQITSRGIRRKASALHLASCAHLRPARPSLGAQATHATPGQGTSTQRHGRSASARAPVNPLTQITSRGIRRKASALHLASCAHMRPLDTSLGAKPPQPRLGGAPAHSDMAAPRAQKHAHRSIL